MSYSGLRSPYGFPSQSGIWEISAIIGALYNTTIGAAGFANISGGVISVPAGKWNVGYNMSAQFNPNTPAPCALQTTLSTTAGNTQIKSFTSSAEIGVTTASLSSPFYKEGELTISTQTLYYCNIYGDAAGNVYFRGDRGDCVLYAKNNYL